MKLLILIIKNLVKYTALVFITYIAVMNVTISISNIIEVLIQSLCLAIILVPPSLISYFGNSVAKNAIYKKTLEVNRDSESAFKATRNLLKTMSDINLVDSNSEKSTYKLESEFSKMNISIKTIDKGKIQINISSIPRIYHQLEDYNKYTRDVKNIITLLKVHLIPEEELDKENNDQESEIDYAEEFKPSLIIYYRLIKSWLIFILTIAIFFSLFIFSINIVPEGSTVIFFTLLFLYIFYIFTNEINKDSKYVICPACENVLISNPFNFKEYKLSINCKYCNQRLFKVTNSKNKYEKE